METLPISQVISFVQNPAFILLLIWVLKEILDFSRKKVSQYDNALKDNSQKLSELTIAIVTLQVKLDQLEKFTRVIPKLSDDIIAAHEKIRDLNH